MSVAAVAVLLSGLSLGVAMLSLGWQIAGFLLSGHRVRANMTLAVLAFSNEDMDSVLEVRA